MDGVAHSDSQWYFTNEKHLCKVPLGEDITRFGDWYEPDDWCFGTLFQDDDFHWGDLDAYGGRLFLPIERDGTPILAVLRDDHPDDYHSRDYVEELRVEMPAHAGLHFAWLAINPQNQVMWSSTEFNSVKELITYNIHMPEDDDTRMFVTLRGTVPITRYGALFSIDGIQGGVFAPNGNLYLVSDNVDNPSDGGIYTLNTNGEVIDHLAYGYTPSSCWGSACGDEPEGIDFLERGGEGNLHVLQVDVSLGEDPLMFKHFRINR